MGEFVDACTVRDRFSQLLNRVDDAYREMVSLSSDEVGSDFRFAMAERLETQERLNRALSHRAFGQLGDPPDGVATPDHRQRLATELRIPMRDVTRRMRAARELLPRRQVSGPPLPPALPLLADALRDGLLGEDHRRTIAATLDRLPRATSPDDRAAVERTLVDAARDFDADFVRAVGAAIDDEFLPDTGLDAADRARRRGVTVGDQGADGMSRLSGWIDPELRTYIEALTAAVRPGHRTPNDGGGRGDDAGDGDGKGGEGGGPGGDEHELHIDAPTIAATIDDRSPSQRCHDAIKLGLETALASRALGSHRGHPVTVIVRTTLAELNQAAHAAGDPAIPMPPPARTGGTTALPMRDLIRMASTAIHYLAVFDDHTERPLYLGRQKRLATADQRLICYSRDGGCTRPGCTAPGYHSEVHHSTDWARGGRTDADTLYFACGPDHDLLSKKLCTAGVTTQARLAWTDGQRPPAVNRAHHPEELLRGDPDG